MMSADISINTTDISINTSDISINTADISINTAGWSEITFLSNLVVARKAYLTQTVNTYTIKTSVSLLLYYSVICTFNQGYYIWRNI